MKSIYIGTTLFKITLVTLSILTSTAAFAGGIYGVEVPKIITLSANEETAAKKALSALLGEKFYPASSLTAYSFTPTTAENYTTQGWEYVGVRIANEATLKIFKPAGVTNIEIENTLGGAAATWWTGPFVKDLPKKAELLQSFLDASGVKSDVQLGNVIMTTVWFEMEDCEERCASSQRYLFVPMTDGQKKILSYKAFAL